MSVSQSVPPWSLAVGISLAMSASVLIGVSFVLKKYGLRRLEVRSVRAADGGYGYLKEGTWWAGMITMALGEILNFVAYMFAPAMIVTPLGAVSIFSTAIVGSIVLSEKINFRQKLGCLLIAMGTAVLVVIAPESKQAMNLNDLSSSMAKAPYIIYIIVVVVSIFVLSKIVKNPKYSRSLIPYILICSIMGTISIFSCKGLALVIDNYAVYHTFLALFNFISCILLLKLAMSVLIQLKYLNMVLDRHPASKVTPMYYTMFSIFVIVFNTFMYKEYESWQAGFIIGAPVCLSITILGVFMTE